MPEEKKPDETPEPDETPLETPKEVETTPPSGKRSIEEIEAENARLRADVSRVNRESAGRRKKLEEYEKAEKERKDADLSAQEKADKARAAAEKERDEAMQLLHETRLDAAIEREAALMGFEYPDDVPRLIDKGELEVENGKVKGLKKALTDLAAAKPKLLREDKRGKDTSTKKPTFSSPPRREMNNGTPPADAETDVDRERSALLRRGNYSSF